MFPAAYFGPAFYAPTYFPKIGAAPVTPVEPPVVPPLQPPLMPPIHMPAFPPRPDPTFTPLIGGGGGRFLPTPATAKVGQRILRPGAGAVRAAVGLVAAWGDLVVPPILGHAQGRAPVGQVQARGRIPDDDLALFLLG